jgi:TolB protein
LDGPGGEIVCLTGNYKYDRPTWSPSGKQIVYQSPAGEICAIDIEGREEKQLSQFPGEKRAPSWSPDGKLIAFHMHVDDETGIYVMNADGTDPRLLAPGFYCPDWSPDGGKIVMNGEVDGIIEIYVMNSDDGNIERLTNRRNHDEFPRWSPDGKSIVYDHHGDSHDICVIDADGSHKRLLTDGESWAMMPDW